MFTFAPFLELPQQPVEQVVTIPMITEERPKMILTVLSGEIPRGCRAGMVNEVCELADGKKQYS